MSRLSRTEHPHSASFVNSDPCWHLSANIRIPALPSPGSAIPAAHESEVGGAPLHSANGLCGAPLFLHGPGPTTSGPGLYVQGSGAQARPLKERRDGHQTHSEPTPTR
jgi:hypothetical protein